jgi:hypothetical protein
MFILEAQGKVPVSPSSVFVSDQINELKNKAKPHLLPGGAGQGNTKLCICERPDQGTRRDLLFYRYLKAQGKGLY